MTQEPEKEPYLLVLALDTGETFEWVNATTKSEANGMTFVYDPLGREVFRILSKNVRYRLHQYSPRATRTETAEQIVQAVLDARRDLRQNGTGTAHAIVERLGDSGLLR